MATLLDSFEIKEIAFRWGGVTRVFRNNELSVDGDEDLETWITASRKNDHSFIGVWLRFEVVSPFFQRLSPSANANNDWLDVKNAILDEATDVEFYPIYSLDNTVKYVVRPVKSGTVPLLKTERSLTYPAVKLSFVTEDQLEDYPDWLKNTRYRG